MNTKFEAEVLSDEVRKRKTKEDLDMENAKSHMPSIITSVPKMLDISKYLKG